MTRPRTHRRFPLILLTLFATVLLNAASTGPCHAGLWPFGPSSPEEEAYEKSRDEFNAVHKGVSDTKDAINKSGVYDEFDKLEKKIEKDMKELQKAGKKVPKELKDAAAKVASAKTLLNQSRVFLENFADYSGKVTTALDVCDEMLELKKQMEADQEALGNLGKALRGLAKGMTWAGDVPVLGDAITSYGKVTLETLDKLREVSAAIDKRNQGAIGIGPSDTNEQGRAFREFLQSHPELKGTVNYLPANSPPYLYVPEREDQQQSLLWDAEAKQFAVVPKDIPVKDIFRMKLLTGERLSASELVMHMEEWPKGGAKRYTLSREVYKVFKQLRAFDYNVMSEVSENSHEELLALVRNPRMFEARYVYDRQTHDQLHRDIKEIYDRFIAKGDQKSLDQAAALRRWAERLKLGIVFTKPEKKVDKNEPSAGEGIFDSISSGLEKLNKTLEKLNANTPAPKATAAPPTPVVEKKVEQTPAPAPPAKPAVKAGGVVGTCRECFDSGLECACGKAACRCCSPGDSGCNAFDL